MDDARQAMETPGEQRHPLAGGASNGRWAAYNVVQRRGASSPIWSRIGSAWLNRDGSITLVLDSFPIGGRIHLREEREGRRTVQQGALALEAATAGPQMCAVPRDAPGRGASAPELCRMPEQPAGPHPAEPPQVCAAPRRPRA